MGTLFGAGVRFLLDQHQRYFRAGLPVYLRVKKFDDTAKDYVQLGFQYTPTGGQATGFTDIKIKPPPEVRDVSLHNIGLNQTRLHFGARYFIVSHSFVRGRQQLMNYGDPYQVFRDPTVVGFFYNSRLFSIESVTHEEVAGETVAWTCIAQAQERQVTVT